jgi:hypothetical protein
MKRDSERKRQQDDGRRESGLPGGGAGRRDEVGGSGVYPASAANAPEGAELRDQAGWGQGDRGAAGYEDSGSSELRFSEEELRAAEEAERAEARRAAERHRDQRESRERED